MSHARSATSAASASRWRWDWSIPPLAVFIGAAPFLVMLTHRSLPVPIRFVGEALEGAARPIGGENDGYVQLEDEQADRERARALAATVRRGEATGPSGRAQAAGRP